MESTSASAKFSFFDQLLAVTLFSVSEKLNLVFLFYRIFLRFIYWLVNVFFVSSLSTLLIYKLGLCQNTAVASRTTTDGGNVDVRSGALFPHGWVGVALFCISAENKYAGLNIWIKFK